MIGEVMVGLALVSCPVDGHGERQACSTVEIDGSDVVTFMWDDVVTCDVEPGMQLNIVFDDSYSEAWGGDASVIAAAAECDDAGGTQVWVQDPYRLICTDVDF